MIDAHAAGFKLSGEDARGKRVPHANQRLKAGGRNGRSKANSPSLEPCGIPFSADLIEFSSLSGGRRDRRRLRRGRKTTMHDRHDTATTSGELSKTRVMSPLVNPREKRGDAKNHQTAQRKSFFVNPSTPIYILSRSEEEREGKQTCQVKEKMQIGVDGLTHAPIRPPRRSIFCVNPLFSRVDMGRHNSGDLIG